MLLSPEKLTFSSFLDDDIDNDSGENQTVRNVIHMRALDCMANLQCQSEESHSSTPTIKTLEQLEIFEKWITETNFIHDNRITFPFASTEIEDNMQEQILHIINIMERYPNVMVRLDSHCGTAAPSGISTWFSKARGLSVRNAIGGINNRVHVVVRGKLISSVVARLEDCPFRDDAREGRG